MGKFRRVAAMSALALMTALSAAAPAAAQNSAWSSTCTAPSRTAIANCSMTARVQVPNADASVQATIQVAADTRQPVLTLQAPLGLYLAAGLELAIDGVARETLPLQTCDARGCYAGAPISATLIEAMRGGGVLRVTMQALDRTPIAVDFSLAGFTAVHEGIR